MNALIPFLWTLGWAVITQVLLFRFGVFWGGYGLLAVHLYGLLKMPVGWPPTTYLMLAAVSGAVMDLVCFTGGMHLAASVTLGMAYPALTSSLESREGLRQGHVMDPYQDGWGLYAAFVAMGVGLYWAVLFGLQNGWPLMGRTLGQTLTSTLLNVFVFLLIQGLLNRPQRGDQRNVSAYPWS
ncbi:MAG: hypothetical protein O2990_07575 [Bacteroidetes bacterium]|nr:hypothetical protein [Bacteroidota bacterium]